MSAHGSGAIGRSLQIEIAGCTVQEPYDVYWKVRNAGPEAASRTQFRGEILKRGPVIDETSNFAGAHWVQVWIVRTESRSQPRRRMSSSCPGRPRPRATSFARCPIGDPLTDTPY